MTPGLTPEEYELREACAARIERACARIVFLYRDKPGYQDFEKLLEGMSEFEKFDIVLLEVMVPSCSLDNIKKLVADLHSEGMLRKLRKTKYQIREPINWLLSRISTKDTAGLGERRNKAFNDEMEKLQRIIDARNHPNPK